jgi:hypothetical protein
LDDKCCSTPALDRILDIINGINEKLELTQWEQSLIECNEAVSDYVAPNDLSGQLFTLSQLIKRTFDKVPCDTGSPALPEIFLAKAATNKPQLQIQWKTENSNSRWTNTIPHFDKDRRNDFTLSSYIKGRVTCTLDLLDNSSIVINAIDENEGRRIISEMIPYILSEYRPNIDNMKSTKNPKVSIREGIMVQPTFIKYWSGGDLNSPPDWIRKLS